MFGYLIKFSALPIISVGIITSILKVVSEPGSQRRLPARRLSFATNIETDLVRGAFRCCREDSSMFLPTLRNRSRSKRKGSNSGRSPAGRSCLNAGTRRLVIEQLENRCLLTVGSLSPAAAAASQSSPDWVYAVVAANPPTTVNAGELMAMDLNSADANSRNWFPVGAPLFAPPQYLLSSPQPGFSGVAFSADGKTLYAATSGPAAHCMRSTPRRSPPAPVAVELPDGTPISIGDLALNPTTNELWGLAARAKRAISM